MIDATIRGTNAIDTRVSTVKLSSGTLKNPCTIGETVPSNLTATCTNAPDRTIRLSVTILEGSATVRVDGAEWPSGVALPFCRGNETRTAAIALVSLRSGPLRIRYTLSDDNGYITSQEQSTYCKQIHPLTTSYTEQPWSRRSPYTARLYRPCCTAEQYGRIHRSLRTAARLRKTVLQRCRNQRRHGILVRNQ